MKRWKAHASQILSICPRGFGRSIQMKNRIKELRSERKFSQSALAGELGVSRQTVISIETGKYDPSLPLAFKIAQLFQKSIEEIFDAEN